MIDKSSIHPYSHQENGIVERANKEVLHHLRCMVNKIKINEIGKFTYLLHNEYAIVWSMAQ